MTTDATTIASKPPMHVRDVLGRLVSHLDTLRPALDPAAAGTLDEDLQAARLILLLTEPPSTHPDAPAPIRSAALARIAARTAVTRIEATGCSPRVLMSDEAVDAGLRYASRQLGIPALAPSDGWYCAVRDSVLAAMHKPVSGAESAPRHAPHP